jgi:hypothetical protein
MTEPAQEFRSVGLNKKRKYTRSHVRLSFVSDIVYIVSLGETVFPVFQATHFANALAFRCRRARCATDVVTTAQAAVPVCPKWL